MYYTETAYARNGNGLCTKWKRLIYESGTAYIRIGNGLIERKKDLIATQLGPWYRGLLRLLPVHKFLAVFEDNAFIAFPYSLSSDRVKSRVRLAGDNRTADA